MNRFQFVADHQHAFEVKRLCEIVQVARSSVLPWLTAAPARAVRRGRGCGIGRADPRYPQPGRPYGVPRITAELNDGAPADAGQPQASRPGDARARHRRAAAAAAARTTIPDPADQTPCLT